MAKKCEHGNREDECSRCNLFCDPNCGEWYCDQKDDQIAAATARADTRRLNWLDAHEVTLTLHGPHRTSIAAREVIDAAIAAEEG